MGDFQFHRAERRGVPALIGLWGPSNAGKTFTALLIARGLVGPQGKIGLLDTENGRALFYSDLAGGWDHLDLQPPFTPERYSSAFESGQQYGAIIVDSASHVWEGEGGVLDMADRSTSGGLLKWQQPKMAYKRMVNKLLRSPSHVIFCLRAKDGVKQTGSGKSASIATIGAQPICGKGFIFEMTVSVLLGPDHCPAFQGEGEKVHCDPLIPAVKAPEALAGIFHRGQPLGVEAGEEIAKWIAGGVVVDHAKISAERVARDVATMGTDKLALHWRSLSKGDQRTLAPIKEELKSIASEADREESQRGPEPDQETGEVPL